MIRSIRLRLVLVGGLLLLAFVLLSGIAINSALNHYTRQAEFQRLQGLVYGLLAATDVDDQGQVRVDSSTLPETRLTQSDSGLIAYIIHTNGTTAWRSLSTLDDSPSADLQATTGEWHYEASPSPLLAFGFEWVGMGDRVFPFVLRVEDRSSPLYAQKRIFTQRLWWGLAGVALILLLTLLVLLLWGLRPLRSVVEQLEAIRHGQRHQIDREVPSEIQPLTDSINTLLLQERSRQERYRHAMADLAHSLKTPLAVLKAQTTKGSKEQDESIQRIDQIISYQLQRAAVSHASVLTAPILLKPGLERTIKALQKVYADKQLTFGLESEGEPQYTIDEGDWMELCGNLLDNAAKHARRQVWVTLKEGTEGRVLTISDDGPGFPDDPKIYLQRGKRADTLAPGQGIGLAVVAELAEAYRFLIWLGRSSEDLTTVRITLP